MITFGNLSAAYLFCFLPILSLLWYWKGLYIRHSIAKWISPHLQRRVMQMADRRSLLLELIFWNSIGALLILALMDPRGDPHYLTTQKAVSIPAGEVIFLIDASASMAAKDTRTGQSRFEIAKEIAQQAIEQLSGNSIALFAFTSQLTPLSPLTPDLLFVHMMVSQLSINEGGSTGTDLYKALNELIPTLKQNQLPKTVVLISDGEGTEGNSPENMDALIDQLVRLNTTIEVVGMGSESGGIVPGLTYQGKPVRSQPDFSLLQQIAARGRGNYLDGFSNSSLALASELSHYVRSANHGSVIAGTSTQAEVLYAHYRAYPVIAALVLIVIYRFFPAVWLFVMMCCCHLHVEAASPYAHALYQLQAGDFPQAVREWELLAENGKTPWERGISLYNLACVQMMQQKWQDALNTLELIPLSKETPPLLTYHVLWNKAWAGFQLKNSPQDILDMLEQSKQAYCEWQKEIGASDCTPPQRYKIFENLVISTPYKPPVAHTFTPSEDPVDILKQLIRLLEEKNIPEVLKASLAFEQRAMEIQKEKFATACQYHPWNEVYPPFFTGVTLIKYSKYDPILQAKALVKFHEALDKLTQPPENYKGSCWGGSNSNLLQEMQSMNTNDTQPKKVQQVKGGGKPW